MIGSPELTISLLVLLIALLVEMYRKMGAPSDQTGEAGEIINLDTRFVRSFIVTHTDFDGMASGTLLLRHLGRDSGILFSSPGKLTGTVQKAAQSLAIHDNIYIADLSLQPRQEERCTRNMQELADRQIQLHWYDHHEWPAGLQERIGARCRTFQLDQSAHTAAQLIRPILPADDLYADRILKFVLKGSLPEDEDWDKTWRMLLSEVVNRRDPDLSAKVLQQWSDGEGMGIMEEYLARQGLKREALTKSVAEFQHRKVHTRANRSFLVIDIRSRRLEKTYENKLLYVVNAPVPSIMVGSLACKFHNTDFCLVVWDDFRYSVYRGEDRTIDFSGMFPQVQTGDTEYRVAGHGYAASVRVMTGMKNRLRALFRFKLPVEAENFVNLLKERY